MGFARAPEGDGEGVELTALLRGTLYVLGSLVVVLIAALFGFNFYRKRKLEQSDQFKSTVGGLMSQDDGLVAALVAGVGNAIMNTEVVRTRSCTMPT